ncbi:translation initiation factor IF-2-like isoform X2 [Lutra lutra]|uniref:translation initiation factor IF-2-like isoform X2 n=1 Tax=Lutra lutra TaxID=9657 RepID=UPI001FD5127D|nr:translation initiation factor IF-2-like isoform X2 [Lutra lutra]
MVAARPGSRAAVAVTAVAAVRRRSSQAEAAPETRRGGGALPGPPRPGPLGAPTAPSPARAPARAVGKEAGRRRRPAVESKLGWGMRPGARRRSGGAPRGSRFTRPGGGSQVAARRASGTRSFFHEEREALVQRSCRGSDNRPGYPSSAQEGNRSSGEVQARFQRWTYSTQSPGHHVSG